MEKENLRNLDRNLKMKQGENFIEEDNEKKSLFFDTYAFVEIIKWNPNCLPYGDVGIITTKLNIFELYRGCFKDIQVLRLILEAQHLEQLETHQVDILLQVAIVAVILHLVEETLVEEVEEQECQLVNCNLVEKDCCWSGWERLSNSETLFKRVVLIHGKKREK